MENNKLYGANHIYKFTIEQTIKSKSFRNFTIILCLIILVSMPLIELITNGIDGVASKSDIKKVYIIDETGFPLGDYNSIKEEYEQYENIVFEYTHKSVNEMENELQKEDEGAILLHISQDEEAYNMEFIRTPAGSVSEIELIDFQAPIYEAFQTNLIANLGVPSEQIERIQEPIITDVQTYTGITEDQAYEGGIVGNGSEFNITFEEYYIVLIAFVFVVMVISYGGQAISTNIVTEKSTNLIEILLTSVRPMAVIVGKVFAMLMVTLGQLILVAISFGASCVIYKIIFNSNNYLPEVIYKAVETNLLQHTNIPNLIVCIIMYILGFVFYGFFAGLIGATVSKIEELQDGMVLYSVLMIIGAYMGLGLAIMGINGAASTTYAYVVFLLPISSMFIAPIYLLIGKLSIEIVLLSVLVLIISTVLLVKFTANVYQTLILQKGNKIKLKDIFAITKTSKEAR